MSPFGGFGSTAALAFVLIVAAVKAIFEDKKRHQEDHRTNKSTAHVVHGDGEHMGVASPVVPDPVTVLIALASCHPDQEPLLPLLYSSTQYCQLLAQVPCHAKLAHLLLASLVFCLTRLCSF